MTIEEFILLDKAKVRRDSNLMSLYLEFFKNAFGRVSNCAGCSFATDWQKLVSLYSNKVEKKVTLQKVNPMRTITIKKIQGKILTYRKDGKTYRQYDNILTDEFIKNYIEYGVEGDKESRLKMFNFPVEEEFTQKEKTDLLIEYLTNPEIPVIKTENTTVKKRVRKSKK